MAYAARRALLLHVLLPIGKCHVSDKLPVRDRDGVVGNGRGPVKHETDSGINAGVGQLFKREGGREGGERRKN